MMLLKDVDRCGDEAASLQSAVRLTDAGMFLAAGFEGNQMIWDEAGKGHQQCLYTA